MKSVLAAIAACVALAAFRPFHQDAAVVTVSATCTEGKLGAHSVSPEDVSVAQGADVDWELDESSNATSIDVGPKHPGHWPYNNDAHFKGGHGPDHPAKGNGNAMKGNAKGKYPYNIMLSCPDGNGGSTTVTIDPNIIIH
jgi:hypothetical protein